MKSYIENIIGSDKENILPENNIRYMLTDNTPDFQPTDGVISKDFSLSKLHFGIDIVSDESTPIVAIANGIIIYSDFSKELGNGVIIGAGSVVTKNIEDYSIVAGNPVKLIRKRFL
mgnify:CR=1 FL=1